MILSVGLILAFGLLGNRLFEAFRLPGLVGMLLVGMLLGPSVLNWLDVSLLAIANELRMFALIVILLRAGFGLERRRIMATGWKSVRLAIIPSIFEAMAIALLAMWLFDFTFVQGGILGFIIAAVSPAVVVPAMLGLIEKRKGRDKNIPTMILGAAALDDVIAITFISMFLGLFLGTKTNVGLQLLNIPLGIALGIGLGLGIGFFLVWFFRHLRMRDSKKVVLIISVSFFLLALEHALEGIILFAAFLAIMALGLGVTAAKPALGARLAIKMNKIWVFAEIFLFVLIGAAVDLSMVFELRLLGVFIIVAGLLMRSLGVWVSIIRTNLNVGEKVFTMVAYWPKATVQAAFGAIPLSLGVAGGEIILTLSVLSIVLTAPLGAILIDRFSLRLKSEPMHN